MATRALARFKELAVPPLLELLSAPTKRGSPGPEELQGALIALRLIVQGSPGDSLPREYYQLINDATEVRLQGQQNFVVVAAACELAHVSKDVALERRARYLATNDQARKNMGIVNANSVRMVGRACEESSVLE